MSLDQRSTAILSHMVKAQTYVSVRELTEKFHISRRTIYYDIEKINDWLKDNQLPMVKNVRSAGFILEDEARKHVPEKLGELPSWHYEYSAKERKAWLAIYLIARETPLFLENLMEKLRVSRNTTIEDLKALKTELERFELTLLFDRKDGYLILGEEDNKRKAIVYYLQHVLTDKNWQLFFSKIPFLLNVGANEDHLFDYEKLKAVQRIIGESEQELNLQFTDEVLYNLSVRLLLFCKRAAQGKKITIDPIDKEILQAAKPFQAAKKISDKLSVLFELEFPEEEILYMTKHLLSSRIQFSKDLQLKSLNEDEQILTAVVSDMVADFQKYACVFFENRTEIESHLLLHIKPAYYRIQYGLEFESDMTETIKKEYHDIFLLTQKVIVHLEAVVGKQMNEHEIALIAMHFGGWMRKVGVKPAARKSALLVCTNGVGTSRLLMHQLEGLFSTVDLIGCVSLRDYERQQYQADFIISTIPLEEKDKPVFVVSPILTETEKESLLKKVIGHLETPPKQHYSMEALMEMIGRHAAIFDKEGLHQELKQYLCKPERPVQDIEKPPLASLLKEEAIQLKNHVTDWQEAIRTAAKPLLKNGFITEAYTQAMIENIEKMGPYIVISPSVAIPHARPEDGVHTLSMSMLKLEKAVPFSEKAGHDIHLVIVLAAVDGETHLKALSQLTTILSEEENIKEIIQAGSSKEIFQIVSRYSR
ncbi:BglG family transcription antiterminator [Neobacillus muris]|uniref:BglG family transcription antiterminator n=1 Tax=Neobacillus muris TaxID=2941334 RepID=UPI00203D82CC|nr:BglG family transcription antiterminator [Neobacillus muris]